MESKLDALEVLSYNDRKITDWQTELKHLDKKINALKKLLDADKKKMDLIVKLNSDLSKEKAQREVVVEAKVEAAQVKQKQQTKENPITALLHAVKRIESDITADLVDELKLQVKDGIKDFFDPMVRYYEENIEINCRIPMEELSNKIDSEAKQSHAINSRVHVLARQIAESTELVHKLRDEPAALVQGIRKRILNLKSDYEREYPTSQSEVVRICLVEIETKINLITSEKVETDKKVLQRQYLELAGFLWRMFDQFYVIKSDLNAADTVLANRIFAILRDMHINKEDDLPFEMALHTECAKLYASKFDKHIGLNDLREGELNDYNKALEGLETALGSPQILETIKLGAQCVKDRVEECKDSDIKFATRVLTATTELVKPGGDTIINLKNYLTLADNASGKPSNWVKVAGGMLALAGLAFIGLSIFGAVVSFGGASPLSIFGIQFGASLVVNGVLLLTGSVAVKAGYEFFKAGKRSGVSQSMVNLESTIKTPPVVPSPARQESKQTSDEGESQPGLLSKIGPMFAMLPTVPGTAPIPFVPLPTYDAITPVPPSASAPALSPRGGTA